MKDKQELVSALVAWVEYMGVAVIVLNLQNALSLIRLYLKCGIMLYNSFATPYCV